MGKAQYLFEVVTLIPSKDDGETNKQAIGYYVAEDMRDIVERLNTDFEDERTEVLSITQKCAVLAVVPPRNGNTSSME